MAISTAMVADEFRRLEENYGRAVSDCMQNGGSPQTIEYLQHVYMKNAADLQRKYCMDNNAMNQMLGALNNPYQGGIGIGGSLGNAAQNNQLSMMQNVAMGQQQVVKPAEAEEGVLMFRGSVMPEKWMGAYYNKFNRSTVGKQWKISYTSEYSSDTIMLWLSMDQYSGNDADKVAVTYLESINQRRLG